MYAIVPTLLNLEGAMPLAQRQNEPFIFRLIREILPAEDVPEEEHPPTHGLVVYLLMALAGIAALLYGWTFGPLSGP